MADLDRDPAVVSVEIDRQISAVNSDPFFVYQWALNNEGVFPWHHDSLVDADIDAPEAWELSTGKDVAVAVVDTGVQASHADLIGAVADGWDYVEDDATPQDEHGHGTHVAGIIAARTGNGVGISGVAPEAQAVPLRVLDGDGNGVTSKEVQAFAAAAADGIRIVNASFGSAQYSASEDFVIRDNPNTLFVVAAGNTGTDIDEYPEYPCALDYANVICVGASTASDEPAEYSNYGRNRVDIFAPGEDIASTWADDGYALESGTSMAAPHVSGTAALIASAYPELTVGQLRKAILTSVDKPEALRELSSSGGRLNAASALALAAEMKPPATIAEPAPPRVEPPFVKPPQAPKPPTAVPPTKSVLPPVDSSAKPADAPMPMLLGLAVKGKPRTKGGSGVLSVRLKGPATLRVRLQYRQCSRGKCRWRTKGRFTHKCRSGTNSIRLLRRTPRTGKWRATVSTSSAGAKSAQFSVRR
jgi:subtilisin family serine protease